MTVAHPGADYCALCLVHGVLTPAMDEWPGAPCCREHVAECIAKASGQPVVTPTVDHSSQSPSLH
jgi:hypothetical protein